jgi:hypothetical protein
MDDDDAMALCKAVCVKVSCVFQALIPSIDLYILQQEREPDQPRPQSERLGVRLKIIVRLGACKLRHRVLAAITTGGPLYGPSPRALAHSTAWRGPFPVQSLCCSGLGRRESSSARLHGE